MNSLRTKIRMWAPPVAVIGAVLASANYGFSKRGIAAERVQELKQIGSRLSQASELITLGTVRPETLAEIKSLRQDVELRMSESAKPGVVQGQLVASARSTGLELREVRPMTEHSGPQTSSAAVFPAYRVTVEGSYRQIAEFMQACKVQRVPARVASFQIAPAVDMQGKPKGRLKADLVMESFLPKPTTQTNATGSK
ncbi:MAG: hypothetical protein HZA51_02110 [Planctomycetes bacterium]|nr:hypothetical protein [Planctomycetota bacterium]